jgi:hypothetical protein
MVLIKMKKKIIHGIDVIRAAAPLREILTLCCPWKMTMARGIVCILFDIRKIKDIKKSFHVQIKANTHNTEITGLLTGNTIRHRTANLEQPSIFAASRYEAGNVFKTEAIRYVPKAVCNPDRIRITEILSL